MADTEIIAMSAIVDALAPLDDPAKARVLRWAAERFDVSISNSKARSGRPGDEATENNLDPESESEDHADFAELFAAASPTTEADKALVAGYWFQVVKGQADIESFQINKELRNLGHGIGSINRAFDRLIDQKPQLVIQLKKSGKSQQARKKYRVTKEGVARVKAMLTSKAEG